MVESRTMRFPLYEKAEAAGVLSTGNGLVVAPTATGKSYIGREIIRRALRAKLPGLHAYLVPYRALASEIAASFQNELSAEGLCATVRMATGDYTDPIHPEQTNVLVATYERFSGLVQSLNTSLGRLVVDEVHLVADHTRGPLIEGLLARMLAHKRVSSLCVLSAAVANPEKIAEWLGVPVVVGDAADRTVQVDFSCEVTSDTDQKLLEEIESALRAGEQVIVFCQSKLAAQVLARDLKELVGRHLSQDDRACLREVAAKTSDDEDADELHELLGDGVAWHHAGLPKDLRDAVEAAFRERHLKVIACTPTLAAGVNLPANLVIVRDVFRTEFVRGFPQRVILSTGELLNMLGRAGRPGEATHGRGVALVQERSLDPEELEELEVAIKASKGNPVTSRLGDSFDALMRFVLAVICDRGEATMHDIVQAFRMTLWYREQQTEITFDRPLQDDIMEDIPSFSRVTSDMYVERAWPVADGVSGTVVSGPKRYNFSLRFSGDSCDCPAKMQWRRGDVCKHLACAIHYLLFDHGVDTETRSRAMYACGHRFRHTLDLGTKIKQAVDILCLWQLIDRVAGGYAPTPLGILASSSRLDLLMVRTGRERVVSCDSCPSVQDICLWAAEDFFGEEIKRERWKAALVAWLNEVDIRRFRLPERHRGDFERGLEDLGQVVTLYGAIAESLGKSSVAQVCQLARGCLTYGVRPELIPLMSLRLPNLRRARCRFLHDERNIKCLEDLASADPNLIAGPHVPLRMAEEWVVAARQIHQASREIAKAEPEEQMRKADDFLQRFMVDQLALFGPEIMGA